MKIVLSALLSIWIFGLGGIYADSSIVVSGVESGGSYSSKEVDVYYEVRGLDDVKSSFVTINGDSVTVDIVNGLFHFTLKPSDSIQDISIKVVSTDGSEVSRSIQGVSVRYDVGDMVNSGAIFRIFIGLLLGVSVVLFGVNFVWYVVVRGRERKSHMENASLYLESTRLLNED